MVLECHICCFLPAITLCLERDCSLLVAPSTTMVSTLHYATLPTPLSPPVSTMCQLRLWWVQLTVLCLLCVVFTMCHVFLYVSVHYVYCVYKCCLLNRKKRKAFADNKWEALSTQANIDTEYYLKAFQFQHCCLKIVVKELNI